MTIDEYRRGIPTHQDKGKTIGMLCETKERCITDDEGVVLTDKLEGLKKYTDDAYANSNLYTDTKIGELINGAPTTLDTLKEIADAMEENADVVEALDAAVGSKVDQAEYDGHADNGTIHITAAEREAWNNNSSEGVQAIIDGTTTVGNANKLGGKGASEYALGADLANYLPLSGGGTVQANSTTPFGVKNTASATGTIALIAFGGTVGKLGGLGFKNTNQPVFQYSEGGTEDILHTGNVDNVKAPIVVDTSASVENALYSKNTLEDGTERYVKMFMSSTGKAIFGTYYGKTGNNHYNPIEQLIFGLGALQYHSDGITKEVLHSGNVGEYALPNIGGTLGANNFGILTLDRHSANFSALRFKNTTGTLGLIGMNAIDGSLYRFASNETTKYEMLDTNNSAKCVVVDTDPGVGTSVSYADGTLIFVKE